MRDDGDIAARARAEDRASAAADAASFQRVQEQARAAEVRAERANGPIERGAVDYSTFLANLKRAREDTLAGDRLDDRNDRAPRANGPVEPQTVAFVIPKAQRAALLRAGLHPEVLPELRPQDVQRMHAGDTFGVFLNARRAPAEDLAQLKACLNGPGAKKSSTYWAEHAQGSAPAGDVITASMVDAIKAGAGLDRAPFWLRDALWVALN